MDFSSWVTAVATVVLAIITFFYARYTKKIIKQNADINRELMRPYVVVDLLSQDQKIHLRIRNIGKRPAYDVNIDIDPSIDSIELNEGTIKIDNKNVLSQSFISPEYEQLLMLTATFKYLNKKEEKPQTFTTKISYKDSNKIPYDKTYKIDLGAIVYQNQIVNLSDNHYFGEMSKQLKEINETIKNKK